MIFKLGFSSKQTRDCQNESTLPSQYITGFQCKLRFIVITLLYYWDSPDRTASGISIVAEH